MNQAIAFALTSLQDPSRPQRTQASSTEWSQHALRHLPEVHPSSVLHSDPGPLGAVPSSVPPIITHSTSPVL